MSFYLSLRVSFLLVGAGCMPRRCAATPPFLTKRHPHPQFFLLPWWRRRCEGIGYMRGPLEDPTFDVRLLRRCLQKSASTLFRTLYLFSMTKFLVTRLKGSEHCDWMQSRQSLRKAIETRYLSLPGLVHIVSNIIGVWPLIDYYLKKTGKRDNGESLVVCLFLVVSILA